MAKSAPEEDFAKQEETIRRELVAQKGAVMTLGAT